MTPFPIQITFRHLDASPTVEALIREKAAELKQLFPQITSTHVIVERLHHHHGPSGNHGCHISIHIHVPDSEITVSHVPAGTRSAGLSLEDKDIYACVRDAFEAAHRQLESHMQIKRKHARS